VVLFEKDAQLGGQILLAAAAPGRAGYAGIIAFLRRQVVRLGVDVRLGTEATPDRVLAESPEAVVVATGARPWVPAVPGADGKHVVSDQDVLGGLASPGERVVIVDDVGTREGLSAAELSLDQGCRVEVVTRLFYPGQDIGITSIVPLYTRLFTKGVVFTPHTELRAIEGSAVVVANVYSGVERRIEGVDTVVLSTGRRAVDQLYRALSGRVPSLHAVGDCVAPRGVHQALLEATRVARTL
jgi:hypothetical protein